MLLGYARVSKTESRMGPDIETQVAALRRAGVHRSGIYRDEGVSGGVDFDRRSGWSALMDTLEKGDVIVCFDVSRLSRDPVYGLTMVNALLKAGVGVRLLSGVELDTSADNPDALRSLTNLMGLAKQQRSMMSIRTREGQRRAKERGQSLGRPPRLSEQDIVRARDWRDAGASLSEVARRLGVSRATVRNGLLAKNGEAQGNRRPSL